MAYATANDIRDIYGDALLLAIADRDNSGEVDDATLEAALDVASAQIDAYIGSRYVVPLSPVPAHVRQMCIDMAVYRIAHDEAPRTVEMRLRYEDAVKYLEGVAKGTVSVPGADDLPPGETGGDVGSTASVRTLARC